MVPSLMSMGSDGGVADRVALDDVAVAAVGLAVGVGAPVADRGADVDALAVLVVAVAGVADVVVEDDVVGAVGAQVDRLVAGPGHGEALDHRADGAVGHDPLLPAAHGEADQPPVLRAVEVEGVAVPSMSPPSSTASAEPHRKIGSAAVPETSARKRPGYRPSARAMLSPGAAPSSACWSCLGVCDLRGRVPGSRPVRIRQRTGAGGRRVGDRRRVRRLPYFVVVVLLLRLGLDGSR